MDCHGWKNTAEYDFMSMLACALSQLQSPYLRTCSLMTEEGFKHAVSPRQEGYHHVFNKELLRRWIVEAGDIGDSCSGTSRLQAVSGGEQERGLEESEKTTCLKDSTGVTPWPETELTTGEAETKHVGSKKQTLYLQCPDTFT